MKEKKEFMTLKDVVEYKVDGDRLLHSATHEEILSGKTTDVYFIRTMEILRHLNLDSKVVTAEIFPRKAGVMAGIEEAANILKNKNVEIWAVQEGESFEPMDTVMRIKGPYNEFCIYETVILGCMASASGWATATAECRDACGDKPFVCFGSRHVHPAVAPVMERAALIGGADNASCILGAKIMGKNPTGTVPHAAFLIAGDTLTVAKAYDDIMPEDHSRIILVDTFKDEVEETLRVANLLKERLGGIRLDTPSERGGVTAALVREVRARLDMEGFTNVKIFVSGGLYPEKIRILSEAGADAFGIGSYISSTPPIDMTMDIKEIEGRPIAKRGRIPGQIDNPKLKKVK
ncbi:MAG: Nicotinate phosphoribosyltransferase [Firmicutes bacterium]|nr:Nicotinate phosphoribosyltransferase [Bacillota bacterium]MDI6705667.1 nicotinate phosphoribosyltransferase [Bacillota bacterium]